MNPLLIGVLTEEKRAPHLPIFVDNLKCFIAGEPLCNLVAKELRR